jgi:hypothetical protein
MVDALYLLALHLGSPIGSISSSATFALLHIASACGLGSVAELIGSNADYLINDIGVKIK